MTVCTHQRALLFENPMYRAIVEEEWRKTEMVRSSVRLDEFVCMPNHLHGIIWFVDPVGAVPRPSRSCGPRGEAPPRPYECGKRVVGRDHRSVQIHRHEAHQWSSSRNGDTNLAAQLPRACHSGRGSIESDSAIYPEQSHQLGDGRREPASPRCIGICFDPVGGPERRGRPTGLSLRPWGDGTHNGNGYSNVGAGRTTRASHRPAPTTVGRWHVYPMERFHHVGAGRWLAQT